VTTISLETGIQNIGVAYLIIFFNFESPDNEYAYSPLLSCLLLSLLPPALFLLGKYIFQKIRLRNKQKKSSKMNTDETDENKLQEMVKLNSNIDEIKN
jgi:hypothetical protein